MPDPIVTEDPYAIPPTLKREIASAIARVRESGVALPLIVIHVNCFFATKPRHFAAQEGTNPCNIYFCPDLEDEPLTRIRGIIYHELGHMLQRLEKKRSGRYLTESRDFEQDADYKIEQATGIKIYYDEDLIQRAGPGARGTRPRPRGLK